MKFSSMKITLILCIRRVIWPQDPTSFFEKVAYFYSEFNSLQNKAIFSQLPKTSMGSKSRKTVAGHGYFFGNEFFGGKLLIVAGGRSYIICRVFHGLSNAENPIRFDLQLRKL